MLPNSRPRNHCKIAGGGGLTAWFRACHLYSVFPLTVGNSSQSPISHLVVSFFTSTVNIQLFKMAPIDFQTSLTYPNVPRADRQAWVREEAKKAAFERVRTKGGKDPGAERPL